MSEIRYETHSPVKRGAASSPQELVARITDLEAQLDRLYEELRANDREYADLSHRERVTSAELDRLRHQLITLAGGTE